METKKQEEKKRGSLNSMVGIEKFLDYLSFSVKGLKIIDSPTEFERENNLEWNIKKVFTAYYEKKYIKKSQQETFCDSIKFDMDIWRDYCGINENLESTRILINTDRNIEYADGINNLQIHQKEKYGEDDFPYLQLLKHNNFVELLDDSFIYSSLKGIALEEVNDLDENELSFAENKIYEIENDLPENIINSDYRVWYLETRYALDEIKSSIQEKLLTKSRDLKSFVYLIYLVFLHAGFEINIGTSFSDYLALFLRESKETIDKYIKNAAKESLPLWENKNRKTQRLIAILMRIETFNPKKETLDSLSKSICEKIPKGKSLVNNTETRYLKFLSQEERAFMMSKKYV